MARQLTGRLVVATHNPGKLIEMKMLLEPHGVEAVSAGELGLVEPEETEDGEAAKLFFFVLSPREQPAAHLQILATIARLLRNPLARKVFLDATTAEELVSALQGFELAP